MTAQRSALNHLDDLPLLIHLRCFMSFLGSAAPFLLQKRFVVAERAVIKIRSISKYYSPKTRELTRLGEGKGTYLVSLITLALSCL